MNVSSLEYSRNSNGIVPMAVVGCLFFIFGFVTWLNGSLIPFLQIACELDHVQAYLVTMAFYIAYTVTALPMSAILKHTGYRRGMVLGLLIMAVGTLLFIPAAFMRYYPMFLLALFVLGSGLTLLQTASNPYVVQLGPSETAAVRISIMGLLNKCAGIIAPLIFTAYVLGDLNAFTLDHLNELSSTQKQQQLTQLSSRLISPYLAMAAILVVMSIATALSPLPEIQTHEPLKESSPQQSIWTFPQLILGTIALFFYVGVEVIAGDTIGLYGKELGVTHFAQLTSYTMAFMVTAYIAGMVLIPRCISQETALLVSAALGLVLTVLVVTGSSESESVWQSVLGWTKIPAVPNTLFYVALLGLANALVWPAIWPMALNNLGSHTTTGAAFLIMAISGGAIFPLLYGAFAQTVGNSQIAYLIMIPGYLFILFYAVKGHKLKQWKNTGNHPGGIIKINRSSSTNSQSCSKNC